MDYPGWTIETTHPVTEGDPDFCQPCFDAVGPTVAFAADWGSTAHGHQFEQPEGTMHVVVVRVVA